MWGHMWGLGDVGWGWMLGGWIWMVLFWGAIIWLIVWAVNRATGGRGAPPSGDALAIAKARYARGDITRDQFEQIKGDIA